MPEPRNLAEYAAELWKIWSSGTDLDRFDALIESVVRRVVTHDLAPDIAGAKQLLGTLRNATLFADLQRVAEALASVDTRGENPAWRRFYAQALIDTGVLDAAMYILRDLAARLEPRPGAEPDFEWKEATGLLGRVCKQRYVNARPSRQLPFSDRVDEAIGHYDRVYATTGEYWHGGNVLALHDKKHRVETGARRGTSPDAQRVAREILARIPADPAADAKDPWRIATRAEAYLGLGDDDSFRREILAYMNAESVDRFMLRGTLRQLREVWNLDDDEKLAGSVLDLMEHAIVGLAGGTPDRAIRPRDPAHGLERMLDGSPLVSADWLDRGRACKAAVCRVLRSDGIRFVGSGFAFDGGDLPGMLGKGMHIVTNAHVVAGAADPGGGALSLPDAIFEFPKAEGRPRIRGRDCSLVFSSGSDHLDATIVRPKTGGKAIGCLLDVQPRVVTREDHVLILGYPRDSDLQLSMVNNRVLRAERVEHYIQYLVSTDEGSSGSPVFDMGWNVVGLHHYGDPKKRFNRGITWRAIAQALEADAVRVKPAAAHASPAKPRATATPRASSGSRATPRGAKSGGARSRAAEAGANGSTAAKPAVRRTKKPPRR